VEPRSKVVPIEEMVGAVRSGMEVAFGGGGLQRKPMGLARALARRDATDLRLVCFLAGPEADLLIGLKKVASVHFAFFGFDGLGLAPNFRRARQSGDLTATEGSEGMFLASVEAGARGVPFHPCHSGLAGDIVALPGSPYRRFTCPVTGRDLVAAPAVNPEVFFLHVNMADRHGNLVISGDPFLDALLARASGSVFATAERIVDELPRDLTQHDTVISRVWVSGVCWAPGGTGFTGCYPDRVLDWHAGLEYQQRCGDPGWLEQYAAEGVPA
jgi:glutaconate CoA-transferase subunit A